MDRLEETRFVVALAADDIHVPEGQSASKNWRFALDHPTILLHVIANASSRVSGRGAHVRHACIDLDHGELASGSGDRAAKWQMSPPRVHNRICSTRSLVGDNEEQMETWRV